MVWRRQLNILNKTAVDCSKPAPRARDALNVEMVLGLHVTLTSGGCDRDVWALESFVVHRAWSLSGVADESAILYAFVSGK